MKREELKDMWFEAYVLDEQGDIKNIGNPTEAYGCKEADEVMDAMEARIKELEKAEHFLLRKCKEYRDVIKELEAENNSLKADIEVLNDDSRIAKENEVKYHKAYLNELDENARLRCLALHAIRDLLFLKHLYTRKAADFYKQFLPKEQYWKLQEKGDRIGMHTLHYGIAYRKAKNELEKMENR